MSIFYISHKVNKAMLCCIAALLFFAGKSNGQDGYTDRAKKYIDQYATLAILEQKKSGIPASITLGQGILETEAGSSELMTEANNHFGIKCKNGWTGETYTHTDDAPNECFKKYKCAEESFHDHSEHLKRNPRYAPLFKIQQTDYAGWARCLKKCGYATNPQYAQRLIKIIEDFKLQDYTYTAMDSSITNSYAASPVLKNEPVINSNDSEEVDDTDKVGVVPPPSASSPIAAAVPESGIDTVKKVIDTPVAVIVHRTHKVEEGETILKIAQAENIAMKTIRQLNMLNPNEEPEAGTVLQLEVMAAQKPAVKVSAITAHNKNAIGGNEDKNGGDYVAIDRTKNKSFADSVRAARQAHTGKPVANVPPPPSKLEAIKKDTVNKNTTAVVTPPPVDDEQTQKEAENLVNLKNELDKVVYADDTKLIADNTPAPAAPPVAKKPVVNQPAPKVATTYTVKKGDTAFSIAKRNNITVDQLLEWNNIKPTDIKVGKTLRVKE